MRPKEHQQSAIHSSALGCEKGHGEDALLRRHTAVQKRAAIAALVFAKLRGIDEVVVACGQQCVCTQSATRQLERILVLEQQGVLGILGAKVLAELVAKVLRRVA